jgi:hypothetical protein
MQVFNYFNISTTENKSSSGSKWSGFPLIEYVFRQRGADEWLFYSAIEIETHQLSDTLGLIKNISSPLTNTSAQYVCVILNLNNNFKSSYLPS